MRLATIASGSSGNCIYMGCARGNILIDAGISLKRIECGLEKLGLSPGDLDGILITHEHIDHVGGLGVLLRKYHVPVYCTGGTGRGILNMGNLGRIPENVFRWVTPGTVFELCGMEIRPIPVSHDAAQPVIYRIDGEGGSLAVVTDLGEWNSALEQQLTGLNVLLLEANHDIRMLETGPYPYRTKQRIYGKQGHLCNEAAGALLRQLLNPGLHHVLLGHISRTNNYEALALECVKLEVAFAENPPEVLIAPGNGLSPVVEV